MNKLRSLRFLCISISAICIVERGCHFLTDGFAIHRISHWEPPPAPFNKVILFDEETKREIDHALKQKFHYLGSGSQCFAFVSADSRYVLKFFKHHRWRFSWLDRILLVPPFCKKAREKKRGKKYTSYLDTCKSYCISFTQFKEKTGLLFVHLSTTGQGLPIVTIRDRIYRTYRVPLDEFTFLLQRRAIPMIQYITQHATDAQKIRTLITEYLTFIEDRARLGYLNKDPSFSRNFGVSNDSIIEIDIGGCFQDPKKDLQYFYSQELNRIEKNLCILFKKDRSLCMFIQREIQDRRDSFFHL